MRHQLGTHAHIVDVRRKNVSKSVVGGVVWQQPQQQCRHCECRDFCACESLQTNHHISGGSLIRARVCESICVCDIRVELEIDIV